MGHTAFFSESVVENRKKPASFEAGHNTHVYFFVSYLLLDLHVEWRKVEAKLPSHTEH
jgi:hypothetical protein